MLRKAVAPLLALCFAALVVHRIWQSSAVDRDTMMDNMTQLGGEAERALYLVPAGRYTKADISANGPQLPSQHYQGFQARHDFQPKPGDALCPISRTKANPRCTWIIDGETYQFCCPPCIDELVRLAKEHPSELRPPSAYIAN
jgi:hypothetical protein